MRKFINQIDNDLLKMKFSQAELEHYEKITKEFIVLQKTINNLEEEAKTRLEAVVIGELKAINFNCSTNSNSFFMQYCDSTKPHKKWYEFWK